MTERLFHAGIRGTLWYDSEARTYVVTVLGHDLTFEARTYDEAMSGWQEAAERIRGNDGQH